jgi:hypothetical protein
VSPTARVATRGAGRRRNPEEMRVRLDLHLHSTASDGALEPAALVAAAVAGRLDVIGLTDHDTIAGLPAAFEAAAGRLEVVPGVELSTTHVGRELHILGYDIDPHEPELAAFSRQAARRRQSRMAAMVQRLDELGIRVPYEEVVRLAGAEANVGRPHLARVLMQRGHVRTFAEAFDRLIGDGGPAFFPVQLLTPAEAIQMVHRAGGIAVWAHPPLDLLRSGLDGFVALGLNGVEVYRPRSLPSEMEAVLTAATSRGLLATGGSDWHGDWSGPLGEFAVGPEDVAEFLALRGS